MSDLKLLDQLSPIANEMLGGLHAGEAMRLRVRRAAAEKTVQKKNTVRKFVPAVCCAALVAVCAGAAMNRAHVDESMNAGVMLASEPQTIAIDSIAAGEGPVFAGTELMSDLGDGAQVRMTAPKAQTLFAMAEGDIALVTVNGAVYQMLETPKDIGASLLSGAVGSVQKHSAQPSLATSGEMKAGLSNVVKEGAVVYGINSLADTTAVAAEVNGSMRVFQRVSYAGKGPSGASLEDTFSVRGRVKTAELSGVGTLSGDAANRVIAVLLDRASLKSADAGARGQTLTVTLDNGLKLQLGVSGDTLCGCGGWSCPEFFEAFEAEL